MLDLTDQSIQDDFGGHAESGVRALLGSGLEDRLTFGDLFVKRLAFGKQVGDWFFAVNVFSRAERGQRGDGVPVIGGADHDGIDVVAFAKLAEIAVNVAALEAAALLLLGVAGVDLVLGLVGALRVRVAHGDSLDFLAIEHAIEHAGALAAAADKADSHSFGGGGGSSLSQHRGRQDEWSGECGGSLDEMASFHEIEVLRGAARLPF